MGPRLAAIGVSALLLGTPAFAAPRLPADVPLPPERERPLPAEAPSPPLPPVPDRSAAAPSPAPPPPVSAEEIAQCDRWLAAGVAEAAREDLPVAAGPGCAIPLPVRIKSVHLPSGRDVALAPAPLLGCAFAAEYVAWIRDDLAPLFAARGGGLARVVGGPGYECRTVDHLGGTSLSEHATGNAIDVTGFTLRDGTGAEITKVERETTLFALAKVAACARFATVLGPGSDRYHADNLHLDAKARRNDYRLCEWQLPDAEAQ